MTKFDCIQNHIVRFIRANRFDGVENKKCSIDIHDMKISETVYVFNGESFGLKSVFCSDMKCFLDNLEPESVKKFLEFKKKK